ncbi:non-specific lipid-transfer protein 15 [Eutrema salsugineum]|uniref:non-specific lipid-transfer protein 15 n=1 Tax=Eutrema salsugineum TaxID=72664 RepID=UPI000CED6042|nr:non-specific lipid-transfer protein 15 [Eutrema salsugineum]
MNKSILVVCISLVVFLSPTLGAKMMSNQNGDRHCGMAQGKVISSCLHRDNGQSRQGDCCQALYELNLQAETPNARQDLCRCFQEIVWLSPYNKLIGLPEHCGISKAVPFDTKTDCGRIKL